MKRTPVKQKRSKPRRGPMRDAKYREWLSVSLCAISLARDPRGFCRVFSGAPNDEAFCNYWNGNNQRTDAAHTQNNGMGSKGPDSSCAPLCRKHHREYDAGRKSFETKYGVDMKQLAADNYAEYLSETAALVQKSD